MFGSGRASTRMQAIVVMIVVVAIIATVAFYYTILLAPTPFSLQFVPEYVADSFPGQRCILLVAIENGGGVEAGAVEISAEASGASVTVEPQAITAGQVAEVTVIPDEASVNTNLTVTVTGERNGLLRTETATVQVRESIMDDGHDGEEDPLAALATEIRDKFIPWLAANYPELGITEETEWTGTMIRPHILVVMYYLFFSEEWEMGVTWHVTIEPHNWARIYLRHRSTETSPSYAFQLSSWTAEEYEIRAVDLEDAFAESVWR